MSDEALTPQEQQAMTQMQEQEPADQQALIDKTDPPAAAPAPAQGADQSGQQQPPPKEPVMVPVSVVQEERERRREVEKRAHDAEIQNAKMEERLNFLRSGGKVDPVSGQPLPQPKPGIPDPETDALGALKFVTEQAKKFQEVQQTEAQNTEHKRQIGEVMTRAATSEGEFLATMPDYNAETKQSPEYGKASDFLKNSRFQELIFLGNNEQEAKEQIKAETIALAAHALNKGLNPAKLVMDMAKMRGYGLNTTTTVENVQPPGELEKLQRIQKGQRENMSLGNINATPPAKEPTGKDIAQMSDTQFQKWYESMPEEERAKYMGM